MTIEQRQLNPDEAAAASKIDVRIVWHYANLGLITPSPAGYTDDDLAELRRVRRLRRSSEAGCFSRPAAEQPGCATPKG